MSDKIKLRVQIDNVLQKVANRVTSWSSTPSDTNYPSEKLVKDSLDTKENLSNKTTTISSSSTTSQYPTAKTVYDYVQTISISGSGGSYISDYYIDTTTDEIVLEYTNSSGSGSGDGNGGGGSVSVDDDWISNSTNPVESQLIQTALNGKANSTHTHTVSNITDFPSLFSGSYGDLTNKPSYTPTITSSTTGAYKIGSINISGSSVDIYGKDTDTHQSLIGYLQTTDVVDGLNSTSTTAPLSAKQGKVLDEKIGDILTIINGTGGS